jgi:integrase
VSAFERPKGSGQWIAKFQYRGRQVWVPGGPWPTKTKARQAEQRHREQLEARRTEETCASFGDRWLEEWPRKSPSTRRHYALAVRRFAEEFGPTPLGEVERLSARTWALTVPRNVSKTIATMYEDARNVGLIESNPFANLRLPATEKTESVCPPTIEEFRSLLAACSVLGGYGREFRAMIQFAAWTGIRAGELHALQWGDVDGDLLHIRRSRKTDLSIGKPKNGKERTIALLPQARVLDQVPRRNRSPFVFHSARGAALNKGSHHYAWRTVRAASGIHVEREAAGLPNVRWHDLRHFCATQLLEAGLSHFDVSVQLGHEDGGALIMARYGHPSKEAARGRLLAAFATNAPETGSKVVAERG